MRWSLLAAVALALFVAGYAVGAPPGGWNLAGTWTSSAGVTIVVAPGGAATITWVSTGPGNAWMNDFSGQISGDSITGTFQDRPGHCCGNHGTANMHVIDQCHMVITQVTINGGPPSGAGEIYTKKPCTAAARPVAVRFSFRGSQSNTSYFTEITGRGKVTVSQPNADGESRVLQIDSSSITLRFAPDKRQQPRNVTLRIRLGGTFHRNRSIEILQGLPIEVADSGSPSCKDGDEGTLLFSHSDKQSSNPYKDGIVVEGICGRSMVWVSKYATASFNYYSGLVNSRHAALA